MIQSITIVDNKDLPISYAGKLKAFKKGKSYEFKPGVNIIVGENGCGKTTLLELLRAYLLVDVDMCGRGSYNHCINKVCPVTANSMYAGADVKADYRFNTFRYVPFEEYSDESNESFLFSKRNFARLFESQSLSSGQRRTYALETLFSKMFCQDAKLYFDYKTECKDYGQYVSYVERNMVPGDEITVLMDEPDASIDVDNIKEIFGILSYHKPHTQIIAVVHNPFLINMLSKKDVNIIEMSKGYVKKIQKVMSSL